MVTSGRTDPFRGGTAGIGAELPVLQAR